MNAFSNCVSCGAPLRPPLAKDDTTETFTRLVIWLVIAAIILSVASTIIFLVVFNNIAHGMMP